MTTIWRVYMTFSLLGLTTADWNSHSFLQNTVDGAAEEGDGPEKRVLVEAWVPGDFADEISRLRIPGGRELPGRLQEREGSNEEEDEDSSRESEQDDSGEDRDSDEQEEDESEDEKEPDDKDYDGFEGHKVFNADQEDGKRPYVVNYEVTETIPDDTKKPRPKGPVFPLPPPCPGAPPPTFPPPPPPSSKAPPVIKNFFPTGFDSYFPTSYMSQSYTAPKETVLLPWTRLQTVLGPGAVPPPHLQPGPPRSSSLPGFPPHPGLAQSTFQHLQPIFSPQTNHPTRVLPPPSRFPRRASPQRVVVRYHRPAYVIRKIQQIGPGADTLIIRQPTPRVKEVHIHHHHDPGPVIHVHKNDESDVLEEAKFQAELAGQRAESEAELEAAGHFAEPAKKGSADKHIHTRK